jgi:hypothetical protein
VANGPTYTVPFGHKRPGAFAAGPLETTPGSDLLSHALDARSGHGARRWLPCAPGSERRRTGAQKEKARRFRDEPLENTPGSDLLSRALDARSWHFLALALRARLAVPADGCRAHPAQNDGARAHKKKKARRFRDEPLENTPGSDLLSHALTHAVPSAVEGLTSVFGMGTGVTPLL